MFEITLPLQWPDRNERGSQRWWTTGLQGARTTREAKEVKYEAWEGGGSRGWCLRWVGGETLNELLQKAVEITWIVDDDIDVF